MNGSLTSLALFFVGIIGSLDVIGLTVLAYFNKPAPGVLEQTVTACIVGIVGLLKTSSDDRPVITAAQADVSVSTTKPASSRSK